MISMPNVYKPNLLQIKPQYSYGQVDQPDTPENILWIAFQTADPVPFTTAQLTALAAAFDPKWALVWEPQGQSAASYTGSILTDWQSDTGIEYSSVGTFTPVTGGNATKNSAQGCTLISWGSAYLPRYRGGHFRTYLPLLSGGVLTDSWEIESSIVTQINTALTNLQSTLEDFSSGGLGGCNLQLYRFRDNAEKADYYPVNSWTVQPVPATQRRRLRKVTRK
jgi:hypothetical protein